MVACEVSVHAHHVPQGLVQISRADYINSGIPHRPEESIVRTAVHTGLYPHLLGIVFPEEISPIPDRMRLFDKKDRIISKGAEPREDVVLEFFHLHDKLGHGILALDSAGAACVRHQIIAARWVRQVDYLGVYTRLGESLLGILGIVLFYVNENDSVTSVINRTIRAARVLIS